MTLTECQEELLGHLAAMPFLDRLELVAVSGWSRGSVYESVEKFEVEGLAASVPHATDVTPPTRRFYLTPSGLHRLARVEGMTVDELLNLYPVSAQWQRVLLERLDAAAVIYRLAATISNIAHPIRFRWYRAKPMDAAIVLPDERIIGVVRQGLTSDRTAFSKRLWRLRDGPSPSAILVLLPDEVRLRQARRLLAGAPAASFLALERDAVSADPSTPVWRIPSDSVSLDLSRALKHTSPNGDLPTEEPPERVSLPEHLNVDGQDDSAPDHLLPALLKSTEKRCLDLLSDWPWMTPAHLGGVLEVKRSRISQLLQRLTSLGLVIDDVVEGRRRLILSDLGLSVLARRDRTSVGAMKKRWSASLTDPDRAATWRNVSGARARQLLRNIQHTDAVHWFIAVLAKQARSRGTGAGAARLPWTGLQVLPLRREAPLGPSRRLRPAAQRTGDLALLPGMGAPGGTPHHHGGQDRPLPALLLHPPAHRRPRRSACRIGRLRRRRGRDPLSPHRQRGDAHREGAGAPVCGSQKPVGEGGAAGSGLAHP